MNSIKGSENIQKKEVGSDRSVKNILSSGTLNALKIISQVSFLSQAIFSQNSRFHSEEIL